METEIIKNAMLVLQEEKKNLLNAIARGIVADKSANKKVMQQSQIERMRDTNRQVSVINELCANFEDVTKDGKPSTRRTNKVKE